MLCSKPFCKTPVGVTKKMYLLSEQARLNATPFGCGQCLHCRINQARIWTIRILIENMVSPVSVFVTLTYDNENLPNGLVKSHIQGFFKRFRKAISPVKVRYFAVGEYGDRTYRPHYHIALFAQDTFEPDAINAAWPFGFIDVGELNDKSARYISGYITQKLTKRDDVHLQGKPPEFMLSSRRGCGIGGIAIKRIAETLQQSKHYNGGIVDELKIGTKKYPLGRYLTSLLSKQLGISEAETKSKLRRYQDEVVESRLNSPAGHINALLDDSRADRKSQEGRRKIYQSVRKI